VTDEIEEIIKQRVLDMLYDDVRPKKPLEPVKTRTAAEDFMDYEKSKKSLAELYEEDFKKEVLHIPVNTETERAKKEITVVFKKLCYNLDLLSSLHPVPRPVVQNLQVKNSQVPALVLEEVLPHAISQKELATPEQVFDKKKAELKSEEELTKTDKNAARKRHKNTLRTRKKERILKAMNKIAQDPKAQKFEYRRMIKEEKARKELIDRKKQTKTKFTRSSEFFKNFQQLSQEINEKEKKKDKEMPLSKKIKL
jgi:U3 small nucleolar RNA-associated protein MPP10